MKKLKLLLICLSLVFISTNVMGAELVLNDSGTQEMVLEIVNNSDMTAVNFKIEGLPVVDVQCTDPSKMVDFNYETGDVIIYGMDQSVIAGELILTVKTPNPYGSYVVSIVEATGSTGGALLADVTYGGDGVLSIVFSQAQLDATVADVVKKGVAGLDLNEDGLVNSRDVQLVINYME